ncbi:MAG: division/cell wall cluster transcriptional repressor MraZ [Rhodothermales bacterium]|nr:division/cell wall cluster transcriptional repressor MraZ [Rhodothermales bacterium]
MAGFKGQAEYSVDSKGRIAIPAKMRNALNPEAKSTFTITRGFERCIFLYPMDTWLGIEAEISSLNTYNRQTRDFVRSILMWAEEMVLDSQGRVSVPKVLAEFAGVTDKGLIIGALDHIEIWNPDSFASHMKDQADDYETLAERVMGLS